jgi:glycosyltransferase 2 family protein
MTKVTHHPFKKISGIRIVYPVIIGLCVVIFLLFRNFNPKTFSDIEFSYTMLLFILLAIVFMAFRDIGYMYRIRVLTDNDLSWKQAFRVIMLWEFSSTLMPSAVGGTTIAMIFVNKEGVNLGRSTAVVMATSFLDELYFILMFPLLLITISIPTLFVVGSGANHPSVFTFSNEFLWFAVIGYTMKLVYTIVLGYGLFINPRGLKWLILLVFKLPFLRKYRQKANITGDDIITSSNELKRKNIWFWLKAFGGTFFSWCSRYLVVNALILAFFGVSDHFLLFARQLVMSNMMLVSPTPGGSGFSEIIFIKYLRDFIPASADLVSSFATVLAFLWRLVSYYPYLIIGSILLPWWIKKKFTHSKVESDRSS